MVTFEMKLGGKACRWGGDRQVPAKAAMGLEHWFKAISCVMLGWRWADACSWLQPVGDTLVGTFCCDTGSDRRLVQ